MKELAKIFHNDYEKISDDVLWLSSEWILKFNVILNKFDTKHNERRNFHKEIEYVKNNSRCININRSFDYFITIERVFKRNDDNYKNSIMIRQNDIYQLKYKLQLVSEWFTAEHNQGLFARKDGKVFIPQRINPIIVTDLPMNKYIEFEPTVYSEPNTEDQKIGVNMYLGSDDNRVFLEVSRLLSFKYFIDTFNMYQSAQLMLNYIHRPEFGTNMYSMVDSTFTEDVSTRVPKKVNSNNLSYFDTVKNLNDK